MSETLAGAAPEEPLKSIWIRPRATVRALIQSDPNLHVLQLAMAGGVTQSLSQAMQSGVGDDLELPSILLLVLVIGSLFGLAALYIGAAVVQWTGRWIGGQGERAHLRTAIAWSYVPWIVVLLLSGIVFALVGRLPFLSEEAMLAAGVSVGEAVVIGLYGVITLVLGIWSFVILLKGIGEVQGFSAWKAWGNLLLCLLPLIAVGVLAGILAPLLAA